MATKAETILTATDKASAVFKSVESQVNDLGKTFDRVSGLAARFGSIVLLGGAVTGIGKLVTAIDDLDETAQGLGTTAVALSEMQIAAKAAGVGADDLAKALAALNSKAADAAGGNKEAAAVFKALSVSVKDANGALKPTEQLLAEVSDRIKIFADDGARGALVADLFGQKLGPRLVAYLNQGSAALRVSSGLTNESVESARRAAAEIDKLSASWDRFKNVVGGLSARGINAVIDAASGTEVNTASEQLARLDKRIADLRRQAEQRQNPEFLLAINQELAEANRLADRLRQAQTDRFLELRRQALQADLVKPQAPKVEKGESKKEEISDEQRALAALVNELERQIDATQRLTRAEQVEKMLREGGLGRLGEVPQVQELVRALGAEADSSERAADELQRLTKEHTALAAAMGMGKQSGDDMANMFIELSGRADEMRKIMQTVQLEDFLKKNPDFFSDAEVERIVKGIAGITDEAKKTDATMQELGRTFSGAFEDAVFGGQKFSDVLKALEQDLVRLLFRKNVIEQISKFDFGRLFGTSGVSSATPAGDTDSLAGGLPASTQSQGRGNVYISIDARGASDKAAIERAGKALRAQVQADYLEARRRDPSFS